MEDEVLLIEYTGGAINRYERNVDNIVDFNYTLSGNYLILYTKFIDMRGEDIWISKKSEIISLEQIKSITINNKTTKINDYK